MQQKVNRKHGIWNQEGGERAWKGRGHDVALWEGCREEDDEGGAGATPGHDTSYDTFVYLTIQCLVVRMKPAQKCN